MKKRFIPVLLLTALLLSALCGCGGHRKQTPTLELAALKEAESVRDAEGFFSEGVRIGEQMYYHVPAEESPGNGLFLPEYGAASAVPGAILAYRFADYFYVYFAEIDGMPGWLISGRDDGSGRVTKGNMWDYYKTAAAETPEWVQRYQQHIRPAAVPASGSDLAD